MSAQQRLPRDYRVRAQQMTAVYIAVGLGTPGIALSVLNLDDVPGGVKLLVMALVLALFGWLVWASKRCATSADLEGIRVRRFTGSRRLAWADVQDIRAVPNPGAAAAKNQPNVISYAYDYAGRRVQLMYVDDNHVDVPREIAVLRAAWEELRGPDWEPEPEALERIERQAVREGRMLTGMYWGCGTFVVIALVVMVVLITSD
ncbi:PH domain-containing protein [Streptomyces sp. NBC_00249]|uniref:PH domain-containing protein n=1 Tax=Streptomyces sp. NBC_00249 TaxID=2975690 RepID=UPI0022513668|nr:PH domain-containing protein [Streptomyces sp. NBC_00249]MCX5198638.1 PH domain-containing protein [Streptomyces sp. NBC_00249]